MSEAPGRNARLRGYASGLMAVTCLPMALSVCIRHRLDPMASPSGVMWQTITILFAALTRDVKRSIMSREKAVTFLGIRVNAY